MIRWLGQLVALPLKVLLIVVSIIPVFDRLALYKAIWALTRDPYYGRNLILLLAQRQGLDAARAFAEEAFAACPDGSIAAMIGQLELEAACDPGRAAAWLDRAQSYPGLKNPDGLLPLVLSLSPLLSGLDCRGVVDSILARNDLSMDLTRVALITKAQQDLKAGQWDNAGLIAERLLAISEVRWPTGSVGRIFSLRRRTMSREFQQLTPNNLGHLYHAIIASGYHLLGNADQCREHLLECRKAEIPDRYILLNDPDLAGPLSELPPQMETQEAAS
jgi:hypothetical protein